ncbi:M48 family metallopeptidase [Novosphingobium sp. TH158]|uniref:M48 family metallopeptidase n=1 Tax=Novosphingobium sp. TH158 TaxID=2067455 RepID=UPI000C7C5215|nr:M48 family metallopeptidase [Novosphingobium sp. TH158]PLK27024.1 hypothetical protein C0V78_09120 [Novosphingobium sp. TH158]
MRGIALSLALLAAPVLAAPVLAAEPSPGLVAAFRALQADDAQINAIGYRLAAANAPFCADVRGASGLLLLDAAAYHVPANIRSAMRLTGDFAVQAVAPRSPAARAGILAGEELQAVDGKPPAVIADGISPEAQVRLNFLHDEIEAALSAGRELTLRLGGRTVTLSGAPACHAHFELATSGKGAEAGANVVVMSRALLSETRSDDEAAFVLAHELAHVVLDHQARRRAAGRARAVIAETEREADRLAAWLMANAGYDPSVAPGFLRRRGGGLADLFPGPHHDRAETRARRVEQELGELRNAMPQASGLRDWRARFTPPATLPNRSR